MHNAKINFKLLNILIFVSIIYLVYKIGDLWAFIFSKIVDICFPFVISFALAYSVYPIVKKLRSIGFAKWLAISIVCLFCFLFFSVIVILIVPLFYEQILLFLSNISVLIVDISFKHEINLEFLQSFINNISLDIIKIFGNYIQKSVFSIVNNTFNFITNLIIIIFSSLYFLIDMDKIREFMKRKLGGSKNKKYKYVKMLDNELSNYFVGLGQNIIVQLFEYTFVFFLIGHPNYLVLGILASFTTIIPYFGALIVDILALLIASVISRKLFILTLIVVLICPQIDGYIIGPKIYGKSNSLHPLVSIFVVFAGGVIWGFWGIVLSIPVAVIILSTFKFFCPFINDRVYNLKKNKNEYF